MASPDSYWLARCEGWRVVTPTGRLGTVRRLLYGSRIDVPEALLVRTGLLRRRDILLDVEEVKEAVPSEETLLLNARPASFDVSGVLKGRHI